MWKNSKVKKYPSAGICFEVCKNEYNMEIEHIFAIDTKCGILLAVETAFIVFSLSEFKWPNQDKVCDALFLLISLILIIVSMSSIFLALGVRKYPVQNFVELGNLEYLKKDEQNYYIVASALYTRAAMDVKRINNSRVTLFMRAMIEFIISVLFYISFIIDK